MSHLYFVRYFNDQMDCLGAAIVQSLGPLGARLAAKEAGIHVPDAHSQVDPLGPVTIPGHVIGRKLTLADIAELVPWMKKRRLSPSDDESGCDLFG